MSEMMYHSLLRGPFKEIQNDLARNGHYKDTFSFLNPRTSGGRHLSLPIVFPVSLPYDETIILTLHMLRLLQLEIMCS